VPLAFVIAVVVFVPESANVPLAPEDGAVKVTIALLTGFCPPSITDATKGEGKAPGARTLCPFPLVAMIAAGAPVVFVRVKGAGVAPEIEAVTV
jgi:hypothetical protein